MNPPSSTMCIKGVAAPPLCPPVTLVFPVTLCNTLMHVTILIIHQNGDFGGIPKNRGFFGGNPQ